jgi:type IV pilus biogenesis protein CpaD/CtpE
MKITRIITAVVIGLVVLTACETEPRMTLTPDFGNSVRHNMAVHIINPPSLGKETTVVPMDGVRALGAIDRYQKHEVIEPEKVETTEK